MANEEWTFPEEPWYEMDYRTVRFAAMHGETRYLCAIAAPAINDFCRTEDTREAALNNYITNPAPWNSVAIRLIQSGRIHEAGFYLITSDVAREFGLLA